MSTKTDKVVDQLQVIGVSQDEAQLYLYLASNGVMSVLNLSKGIHLSRTKVYRLLDKLIDLGLVEQVLESRGFEFKATGIDNLNSLIVKKKLEVRRLEEELPTFEKIMSKADQSVEEGKRVKYFKGVEGFKQVTWNSLRADRNLFIFEMVTDMSVYVDKDFSEQARQELVKRRIHVSQITNLQSIPDYTEVTELVEKYWDVRFVDPKVLKLSYEMLIYNDVVAMYNMRGDNIFCVEIHDKNLASMQKQLFNYVWESSKKMQMVGEHGEAKVVDSTSKV